MPETLDSPLIDASITDDTPLQTPTSTQASGVSLAATTVAAAALSACGGGGDNAADSQEQGGMAQAQTISRITKPGALAAWRFLNQATMGPRYADVTALMGQSYDTWIKNQIALASTKLLPLVQKNVALYNPYPPAANQVVDPPINVHLEHFYDAWWNAAVNAPDQLRQRAAFALSEIFVVSLKTIPGPYAGASYYDMLIECALDGDMPTLLKRICSHPAMGVYLSHLANQPLKWGRRPDQNFARELLQLFTIGLSEAKANGAVIMDTNNKPLDTYTQKDVEILASIFTGWSWDRTGSARPDDGYGQAYVPAEDMQPQIQPMKAFPEIHENFTGPDFLATAGDRIVAGSITSNSVKVKLFAERSNLATPFDGTLLLVNGQPAENRDRLIDLLCAHPNFAPFIARRMIQRLVTSNPSLTYIGDVASDFKVNKLSMSALVKSVLLHAEAIAVPGTQSNYYGKVREPVLRATHLLRSFSAESFSGVWKFTSTENSAGWHPSMRLGQAPLTSPSVFNFFRPGYRAPGTATAAAGRYAPELQIHNENSAAGYVRFVQEILEYGMGRFEWSSARPDGTSSGDKFRSANTKVTLANTAWPDPTGHIWGDRMDIELNLRAAFNCAVADLTAQLKGSTSSTLVTHVNQQLFGGNMPATLVTLLKSAILDVKGSATMGTTERANLCAARTRLAIYLAMVSPDYLIQK